MTTPITHRLNLLPSLITQPHNWQFITIITLQLTSLHHPIHHNLQQTIEYTVILKTLVEAHALIRGIYIQYTMYGYVYAC